MKPEDIYFLVGCEESQAITIELRKLGVNAFSNDLKPCSGGHPEWHIQGDVFGAIGHKDKPFVLFSTQDRNIHCFDEWHAAVFHPDCTYLTVSGNRWFKDQPELKSGVLVGEKRRKAREKALEFVCDLLNCNIPHVRIENPIGVIGSRIFYYVGGDYAPQYRVFPRKLDRGGYKPDQTIQPWMFGHGETKATCLWNRGFPNIIPTNIVEGREQKMWALPPSNDRSELRSKTYQGIAEAIAKQSVEFLINALPAKG